MSDLAVPDLTTVRFGSRGDLVEEAQILLNAHAAGQPGMPLRIDGTFGPLTHAATLAFQGTHGVTPDGVIAMATWTLLRTPPVVRTIPVSVPGSQALIVAGRFELERLLRDWYGAGKTQAQCGVLLYDYMQHTAPWSTIERKGLLALSLEILR